MMSIRENLIPFNGWEDELKEDTRKRLPFWRKSSLFIEMSHEIWKKQTLHLNISLERYLRREVE